MGITHLAFDLGSGCERCHGVDHDHIKCAGANQHVGDLECLLARIWLRNQEFVDIDTNACGIGWIHCVLSIDIGTDSTVTLRLGDDMHGQGGLARGLRAENLDDTPTREPTYAECDI